MKKEPEKAPNHERWLLTYADLITLLMTFFVVLYALSMVDAGKYKQLAESLRVALGVGNPTLTTNFQGGEITPMEGTPMQEKKESSEPSEESEEGVEEYKLEKMKDGIDEYLQENNMTANVTAVLEERGLVIRMEESLLFDSGQSQVKSTALSKVIGLGKQLAKTDNFIRIEGHTDNIPVSGRYSSNWELSTARALSVTQFLISNVAISPGRLSPVGYSEYRSVSDNRTAEGRAKNRRVDIVLVNNKYSKAEK